MSLRTIATGLRFPEGPVCLADGSVLVTEISGGTVRHRRADGCTKIVATLGGGQSLPGPMPTNICFDAAMTTAYATLSAQGALVAWPWSPTESPA